MNRSDSTAAMSSPVSNVSSNETYINPNSPWVIAVEHHKHGCCTGRYHCDGSKCPQGPVFNPAIGIPLAICTGGLSAAACGIYRGFRDHKGRKEMKKVYQQSQQQPPTPSEFTTPSSIPQSSSSEKNISPSPVPLIAEMPAEPAITSTSAISEKMDDVTPPSGRPPNIPEKMDDGKHGMSRASEKMDDEQSSTPSEIDGTPVDTLPRYSELQSSR